MLVLMVLCGMTAIHIALGVKTWDSVTAGYPDFTIFYSAGKMVRQGMANKLYDETAEWQVQREVALGLRNHRRAAVPFMHAPFEALIFVPLSLLPFTAAYVVWNLINLSVLLLFCFVLRADLGALHRYSPLLPSLFLLGYFPVFNTLLEGQDVILLLLLYAAVFVALKKDALFRAGCWLGLGLFRIHLVVPFLFFMALLRKWRLVAGFMTSALGLASVSALVVGWRGMISYPAHIWSLEHHLGPLILAARANPNLRGLAEGILSHWSGTPTVPLVVVLLSAIIVFLVVACWRTPISKPRIFDLRFSLMLVATVLLSYHTLFYDFTLLALAVILVWNYVLGTPSLRTGHRIELLAPAALLSFTPLYMVFWVHHWEGSYAMALLLLGWAWALVREISRSTVSAKCAGECL